MIKSEIIKQNLPDIIRYINKCDLCEKDKEYVISAIMKLINGIDFLYEDSHVYDDYMTVALIIMKSKIDPAIICKILALFNNMILEDNILGMFEDEVNTLFTAFPI